MPSESPSESPSAQPSETPSANPSRGCDNLRPDCGWGIFNPWTCRCDCPVGICLDSNLQCYRTCSDTINTNPFAGCAPGWDCPWYPDTSAGHCKSEMHLSQVYLIYRTASECCEANFAGSSTCLTDSKNSHVPFPFPSYSVQPESSGPQRKDYYFPDLSGEMNCMYGKNYEDWMMTAGYEPYYLFTNGRDCCSMWYPTRSDCPNFSDAVNGYVENVADDPYSMTNYYFPDFTVDNCGFGRDYPAWMGEGGFEKWYLFTTGEECCTKFFPSTSNCPYESSVQTGYYWESYAENNPNSDVLPPIDQDTYYPDLHSNTCINGKDYPAWMAEDDVYKRLYLYHDAEGCCSFWFGSFSVSECVSNIIVSDVTDTTGTTNSTEEDIAAQLLAKWYPVLQESRCANDGNMPSFMLFDGFTDWYLFNSMSACCGAFDCTRQSISEVSTLSVGDTYYPDLQSNTCIKGKDYPKWMAEDDVYKSLYLYSSAEACCTFWFGSSAESECVSNVIVSVVSSPSDNTGATEEDIANQMLTKWYPVLEEGRCSNDGKMPSFMLFDGYAEWYLFDSLRACCGVFDCKDQP